VDGSYDHSIPRYAFGCVFLLPNRTVLTQGGSDAQPKSLLLRNVTGEMLGAMYAVRFAMVNHFRHLEIRYDYEGIEKWVSGAWKAKTELTTKYRDAMRAWAKEIEITFCKVAAHSNVYYNEMADQIAKKALTQTSGIPKATVIDPAKPPIHVGETIHAD
jgi:ribonuclease HI